MGGSPFANISAALTANPDTSVDIFNVPFGDPDYFPKVFGRRFGAIIESIGSLAAQIVVERAMYSDSGGQRWAAGTNALGTRLQ